MFQVPYEQLQKNAIMCSLIKTAHQASRCCPCARWKRLSQSKHHINVVPKNQLVKIGGGNIPLSSKHSSRSQWDSEWLWALATNGKRESYCMESCIRIRKDPAYVGIVEPTQQEGSSFNMFFIVWTNLFIFALTSVRKVIHITWVEKDHIYNTEDHRPAWISIETAKKRLL